MAMRTMTTIGVMVPFSDGWLTEDTCSVLHVATPDLSTQYLLHRGVSKVVTIDIFRLKLACSALFTNREDPIIPVQHKEASD